MKKLFFFGFLAGLAYWLWQRYCYSCEHGGGCCGSHHSKEEPASPEKQSA